MTQPAQAAQPQAKPVADKRILRAFIARRYLAGSGIEIGALGTPLDLPPNAQAKYVDRMSLDDLYREFPEMAQRRLQAPDIVDNGETLASIPDGSLDFIVANHFLEHCENLLGTLRTHTAKLRKGGRLFYAVPNRDFTFDRHRPTTPFEHLVQDDREGPEKARAAHYLEWATLVNGKQGEEARLHAEKLQRENYSIHYHAWDAAAWFRTLALGTEYNKFPGFVAHFELNFHEMICVLVRTQ
ncbi:MAG: class I SAM-dependent methyltransferase [Ferrovibrio sp.]|uniref:class I SAM-dependent methyltransferase n=1 Tax=Ferrovibrio sp. TaxID=1917215 RepID=UPI0026199E6C|nr:methyltransferase domain-containing protein [Ferrovibrio sp.]MCW0236079.1 class I SAM-dependent methyltransferase [Ferrovibrio sp.]